MSEELADLNSEPIEGLEDEQGIESTGQPPIQTLGAICENKGNSVPPGTRFIVNLYPWAEYETPEGITVTRSWLRDVDEMPDIDELIALARPAWQCSRTGPILRTVDTQQNRSGLVTALALMVEGANAGEAIDHLRACRHPMVLCNTTFESWLRLEAGAALEKFFGQGS